MDKKTLKKRYLHVAVEGVQLEAEGFKHALYDCVFSLLGEAGAARAGVQLKAFDEKKQIAIVRCSLGSVDRVIAALAAKTELHGKPVALRLERISGSVGKKRARLPKPAG